MKLSTNGKYQKQAGSNEGFVPVDAMDEFDLSIICKNDWTPALYTDGYRDSAHWQSCEWLFCDVDNDSWAEKGGNVFDLGPEYLCSIAQFLEKFAEFEFYILTSRNHQKEKKSTKGNKLLDPVDRFHVLFHVNVMTNHSECKILLTNLVKKNKFMDKNVNDPTRFFYGFDKVEVTYHRGRCITPVDISEDKTLQQQYLIEENKRSMEAEPEAIPDYLRGVDASRYSPFGPMELSKQFNAYNLKDKQQVILKGLRIAASIGVFDTYNEWIRLGTAMKIEGYQIGDWHELLTIGKPVGSDTLRNYEYKWSTFSSTGDITGGTLLFFARQGDSTCLVKGANRQDKKQAVAKIIEKNDVENKKERKDGLFSCLLDKPGDDKIKKITNILNGTCSNKSGLIKDLFTMTAISKLDSDFENFCYMDEAIGYPRFSHKCKSIDEVEISILERSKWYGYDPARSTRKDFFECHLATHRFNSMEQLCDKLREENQGVGPEILDKFSSYIAYKSKTGDIKETDKKILNYYKMAWDLFFTKAAMRMLSAYRPDKVANDYVISLVGGEGAGKSFFCRWIGLNSDEFFLDYGDKGDVQLGSPDSIRFIRGKLIVELGEGSFMKKTDDLQFKSFISQKIDVFVDKFQRGQTQLPRTASFLLTSNEEKFMRGLNGNRRMTPLPILGFDFAYDKDCQTIPKMYAHYLEKAEKIMNSGTSNDVREQGDMRDFFNGDRQSSIDFGIHGDYIKDIIHEIELFQIREVMETQGGKGRPKMFIVFSPRMVIDKIIELKVQMKDNIPQKISAMAKSMGYETTRAIKVNNRVSSGYKMHIFDNESELKINQFIVSRHDQQIVEKLSSPY